MKVIILINNGKDIANTFLVRRAWFANVFYCLRIFT